MGTKTKFLTLWIVKLAYLIILWLLFCILGGGIFGWAPATVGLFTILSKWRNGRKCAIFPMFYSTYKKEFISSNISGVIILFLSILFLLIFRTLTQLSTTNVFRLFNILYKLINCSKCVIFPIFFSIYKKKFISSYINGVIILFLAILFLLNFCTLTQVPTT